MKTYFTNEEIQVQRGWAFCQEPHTEAGSGPAGISPTSSAHLEAGSAQAPVCLALSPTGKWLTE